MSLDLNAISQAAVESDNTSIDSAGGGFKKPVPVAGPTLGRIREYVELGKHEPDAQGKAKGYKASFKGYLVIELLHKRHQYEMGDKTVPHEVKIYFNKGVKATSNYKKLFKAINSATGGKAKTFVDLINKILFYLYLLRFLIFLLNYFHILTGQKYFYYNDSNYY